MAGSQVISECECECVCVSVCVCVCVCVCTYVAYIVNIYAGMPSAWKK